MASRMNITNEQSNSGFMMTLTTLMLILVSFFVFLVSRSNFDETKYVSASASIRTSFGDLTGGRVAIGGNDGLPDTSLTVDGGGRLLGSDVEMAQIRALLAPAILDQEARIIHTPNKRIVSLSAGLLFNLDSSEIEPEMAETLSAFAKIMADRDIDVAIEGHSGPLPPQTEGVGDNWDVSGRRAIAVMEFLAEEGGLPRNRLTAYGYAGTKPLHSNHTPNGRARNSRVDLVLDFSRIKAKELAEMTERATAYNFQGFDFLLKNNVEGGQ